MMKGDLMNAEANGAVPALKDVFRGEFLIGAAVNHDQVSGAAADETALVLKHFNTITPENCMKWDTIHPRPGGYNFTEADRFVEFGEKNGMAVIGHVLVDLVQVPEWVFLSGTGGKVDRETLLKRLENHITAVVGRYRGRIHAWQVVNEAIAPDGQFVKTRWYDVIGEEYVRKAFEYAQRADPEVELFYNGHDMLTRAATDRIVRLVGDIRGRGGRVDGVGVQAHWDLKTPAVEEVEAGLVNLRAASVKAAITEMDITVLPPGRGPGANPYPDAPPADVQEALARRYASLFSVFCKHKDMINRVNFWGVHDGQSWLNYWPVAGRTDYPLLFDRRLKPKPAFFAVVRAVAGRAHPPSPSIA